MEPDPDDFAADVLVGAFSAAVQGGMSSGYKRLVIECDEETGDHVIEGTDREGKPFKGIVLGADIADALDFEYVAPAPKAPAPTPAPTAPPQEQST